MGAGSSKLEKSLVRLPWKLHIPPLLPIIFSPWGALRASELAMISIAASLDFHTQLVDLELMSMDE